MRTYPRTRYSIHTSYSHLKECPQLVSPDEAVAEANRCDPSLGAVCC